MMLELVLLAVVLVVVGVGVYTAIRQQSSSSKTTRTIPSASLSATPTTDVYAGWKSYTSSLEKITFKYPSNWVAVSPPQTTVPGADTFALQRPDGVRISWISAIDGLGGTCNHAVMPGASVGPDQPDPCPYWTVTDKEKLAGTDLFYVAGVVTSDGSSYRPWCALQSSDGILQSESNMGYLTFHGKNNAYIDASGKKSDNFWAVLLCGESFDGRGTKQGTKAQAEALLATPDYKTAKQILLSATY